MRAFCKCVKSFKSYICLTWFSGFTLGIVVSAILWQPLPDSIVWSRCSVIGSIFIQLFPLLLYWILTFYNKRKYIPAVVFLRSLFLAISVGFITHIYGEAAWIIRFFIFSCSFGCEFVLITFLLRNSVESSNRLHTDLAFSAISILIMSVIDYSLIYPFWIQFIY